MVDTMSTSEEELGGDADVRIPNACRASTVRLRPVCKAATRTDRRVKCFGIEGAYNVR